MPHTTAIVRVGVAAVIGAATAVALVLVGAVYVAWQAGWDATAITYLALTLPVVWRLDQAETARLAVKEDPTRPVADLLLLAAAVASLGAVGVVLVRAADSSGVTQTLLTVAGVLSVIVSWALVHVTYMLRYAKIYYTEPIGGVDFNEKELPAFVDFAYLAFTIGMTFQVSDTSLQSRSMRSAALRHALLSFLFSTVILATTINVVANLAK